MANKDEKENVPPDQTVTRVVKSALLLTVQGQVPKRSLIGLTQPENRFPVGVLLLSDGIKVNGCHFSHQIFSIEI